MSAEIAADGHLKINYEGMVPASLGELIQHASGDKQFVFLGDSNHEHASALLAVMNPSNLHSMKSAGIKHLFMEMSPDFQPYFDAYAKGTLTFNGKHNDDALKEMFKDVQRSYATPEQNKQLAEGYPAFIRAAKEEGIQIHCADLTDKEIEQRKPISSDQALKKADHLQENTAEYTKYMTAMEQKEPGFNKRYADYQDAWLEQRFKHDDITVGQMKEAAKDGKVAILYGERHFSVSNHFNAPLKQDAVFIGLRESQQDREDPGIKVRPDYVYYTDLKAGEKTIGAAAKIEASNAMSEACKMALDVTKGFNTILGCVDASHDWKHPATTSTARAASPQNVGR